MLYLKWAAFLLPSFLMEIVGKVGAPILAFFYYCKISTQRARCPASPSSFSS